MLVGHALHNLGRHAEAIASHQRSLKLYRDLGDLQHQAGALIQLGDAQQAAGNPGAAREAWQHALAILEGLHHPDVTPFRARLARVS